MSYLVRALGPGDNDALLRLLAATPPVNGGRRPRFEVSRSPDFFALPGRSGGSEHLGVFHRGELAGCLGLTTQRRFLRGQPQDLLYVNDLRVHPRHAGSRALWRLIEHARAATSGRDAGSAGWAFATVLDENTRANGLLSAPRRLWPQVRPLGRTVHLGVPMFLRQPGDPGRTAELSAEEAWSGYLRLAAGRDFAPADRARFLAPGGLFLGLRQGGELTAVCKVVDEAPARRFLLGAPLPARLPLALLCRWRGCPRPPRPGEALPLGYLAYLARSAGEQDATDLLAHLARALRSDSSTSSFLR